MIDDLLGTLVAAVLLGLATAIFDSFRRRSAFSWIGPGLIAAPLLAVAIACAAVGNRAGAAIVAGFAALPLALKAILFFRGGGSAERAGS